MNIKDKLVQLGIVEAGDKDEDTPTPVPTKTPTPGTTFQFSAGTPTTPVLTGAVGGANNPFASTQTTPQPDPVIVNTLQDAVDGSKTIGYKEFAIVYDSLATIADDRTRYATALQVLAASQKISPDQVLASLDDRIKILAAQQESFNGFVAHTTQTEIQARADEAAKNDEQIKALTERNKKLLAEAQQANSDLEAKKAAFGASMTAVQTRLTAERSKIAVLTTPPSISK